MAQNLIRGKTSLRGCGTRARRRLREVPRPRGRAGVPAHRPGGAPGGTLRCQEQAGRRCVGVWSRKASSGDAALVVAMTLALAAGSEIPVGADEIRIY